ncbi:RWD-domain-containing protein [Macrolepiota fuliginosa MF-IS2]|uniref:RBR-type E3 ubiquitin transferase n=1 Tax=Macrolepiota fuliginosa MF-IS2 TaxID=1400762 RepID=A0A9P5XHZ7_9AGAR|nr:RWD-domain-containing protein [Macrolepiota fuliginosa MF-IS2]
MSEDDEDLEACRGMQQQEYEVLESIYPECISSQIRAGLLKLDVPIELGDPRPVKVEPQEYGSVQRNDRTPSESLLLSTLPPLLLQLSLPPGYPITGPPEILSLRAAHLWLSKSAQLQTKLIDQWQSGEPVLYNWIEYIRTGDFLSDLGMLSREDDTIIQIYYPAPHILASLLQAHETSSKSLEFAKNSYPCSICLTSLKGSRCLKLSCDHIFCRSCLEDFWKLCIEEGDVGRVGCADPDCVKAGREAKEEEVARVVSEEGLRRWRWLREKRNLERDPTIVHCLMEYCQTPVPKPADVEEGTGWERFRQCPKCSFSFCAFCRRTWHGPITGCPIAHSEKIVLQYLAADEGSEEREYLEKKFGRNNVIRLVKLYEEEQANKRWLEASTVACPGCEIHVEKNLGCNHMTCWKCGQHFCYRCGTKLQPADPYRHFSTPGQPCYYKLFDFQAEGAGRAEEGLVGIWADLNH